MSETVINGITSLSPRCTRYPCQWHTMCDAAARWVGGPVTATVPSGVVTIPVRVLPETLESENR